MIAFAKNFPHGIPSEPHRPARAVRHRLDAGQALAFAGAAALAAGVFLPFLDHAFLGDAPSLWVQELAFGIPWASLGVVGCAGLAAGLAWRRCCAGLWGVGLFVYLGLALAVLYSAHLAYRAVGRPPGISLDDVELFSLAVGWYVSAFGALLLFGGALVDGIIDHQRAALPRSHIQFTWREREPATFHIPKAARGGRASEG